MRSTTLALLATAATAAMSMLAVGCGKNCVVAYDSAGPERTATPAPGASSGGYASPSEASRAISEADIVQLDHEQNWIYAMSKSGSVAIVDASQPNLLTLKGKTSLAGQPFEMYRRGSILLTMSNSARYADGRPVAVLSDGAEPAKADPNGGATLAAVDISNPAAMRTLGTFSVPGEIADSRIVGDVLYLATYESGACFQCGSSARTVITSFDISDASAPKQIDQVGFDGPKTGTTGAWPTPWKRSIIATQERMYVGGLSTTQSYANEGVIQVLDITDPTGHIKVGAQISTSGPIMSRWQMDESNGVFRVISQVGAGRSRNGEKFPDIDTFRIESSQSIVRVGHSSLKLPRQEALKTVRFDGPRAYAITFAETDPLFTIDLSDPTAPAQKGEIHMPGWVYHIEPRGDRLIGLGLDRRDYAGNLNLSLFDVTELSNPFMIQRQSFGPTNLYSDEQIANGAMAEDQDRIQKAFRSFPDGLVVVPFSASWTTTGGTADQCKGAGGIQLFEWNRSSLSKRGLLTMDGNARRAIRRDSEGLQEVIGVSDSNVTAFSINLRDAPSKTADVVIGTCVAKTTVPGGGGFDGAWEGNPNDGYYGGGRDEGAWWGGGMCE
ncbi:MAG: beta-propeller domain-containing protein [Deltaproteobacteria bacterium]|nr:beta-propeller domain-containing protein [Deltaproteobacteria bacterium]